MLLIRQKEDRNMEKLPLTIRERSPQKWFLYCTSCGKTLYTPNYAIHSDETAKRLAVTIGEAHKDSFINPHNIFVVGR